MIPQKEANELLNNPINFTELIKDCLKSSRVASKKKPKVKYNYGVTNEVKLEIEEEKVKLNLEEERKKGFLQRDIKTFFK